ncbi:hypothetical protein F4778DRAFT_741010 [Xylariomycetidae sp. FL2044]|nr:hypothetical protein F4778DRAFT_741010 [Xylariomycetidae sp. FL2044]
MHLASALRALPPSLQLLLATQLQLFAPATAQAQAQDVLPTAIKKMAPHEGEKFLPEYYAFATDPNQAAAGALHHQHALGQEKRSVPLTPEEELRLALNSSAVLAPRPPYPRHYDYHLPPPSSSSRGESVGEGQGEGGVYRRAREVLGKLRGRQFACPTGTHACTNIDQPNYCCLDGATCFVVNGAPDAGNVGCCPEGRNCGGSVGTCTDGSTACSAEVGGGCCIPGFVCAQVGCVASTVTMITQTTTSTTILSSPTPTTAITTVIITITPTVTTTPEPSTVTQTTTASVPETETDTDTGGLPPVRPTSSSPDPTTTAPSSSAAIPSDYCPTGFYACLASAGSGCCRTGRDCATTSCPPPAMTTLTSNGVTIVVAITDADAAAAAATATATAECAAGWFMCGADAGPVAGCCPSGYDCGTASCTLTADGGAATATVGKELPGSGAAAGGRGLSRGFLWGVIGVVGVVMVGDGVW